MRKLREVLRLKHERRLSNRRIGESLKISHSTVAEYLARAHQAGVGWPVPEDWDDDRLEAALLPPTAHATVARPVPEWSHVYRELARHKGVTLELLWLEYKREHSEGYQYSQFCELYRKWRGRLDVSLRQPYRGGEKVFVDYAGPSQPIVDRHTGEIREAAVFVGALGASSYTFVDLTWSRSLPDWTASHARMFEFFGGVPELVVPDNEKSAVTTASHYEPDVNPSYHDLATHYGTTVLPTRPHAPRDKAKAEAAVQAVERWVMAPLRNHTFFSLGEGLSLLLVGATGSGKSYLACALGHQACRHGLSVRYFRLSRLLDELRLARGDGSRSRLLQRLARAHLLILDDWGLAPLDDTARHDLPEVLDDRYSRRGTLLTSQVPIDHWHEIVGDPTFGDAILDRLLHNAHRITLKGGSMRRVYDTTKGDKPPSDEPK